MEMQERKHENEMLLLQLHEVQEELERYFLLNQECEKKLKEYRGSASGHAYTANPAAATQIVGSPVIVATKVGWLARLTDYLGLTVHGKVLRIQQSGIFDTPWYLRQNPDVAKSKIPPVEHYLRHGAAEGRNPSPHFSTEWYISQYPDVAREGINPLLHYISHGQAEGRRASWNSSPGADISTYAVAIADLRRSLTDKGSEIAWLKKEIDQTSTHCNERVAERQHEIETLKQVRAQLEAEKAALAGRQEESAQLAEERGREIETLKQVRAQLEAEKAALAGRQEESAQLATERLNQINELQRQIQSRQAGEADLAARQQLMHEEMVRAEAQLDLIKDMILREPGL
jgi:hypothetical protein